MLEPVSVFEQDKITTYESCRQLAENQANFFDMDELDYCTVRQNHKVYYKKDKDEFIEDFTNYLVKAQDNNWNYHPWDMDLYLKPKKPSGSIDLQYTITRQGVSFAELVNGAV